MLGVEERIKVCCVLLKYFEENGLSVGGLIACNVGVTLEEVVVSGVLGHVLPGLIVVLYVADHLERIIGLSDNPASLNDYLRKSIVAREASDKSTSISANRLRYVSSSEQKFGIDILSHKGLELRVRNWLANLSVVYHDVEDENFSRVSNHESVDVLETAVEGDV